MSDVINIFNLQPQLVTAVYNYNINQKNQPVKNQQTRSDPVKRIWLTYNNSRYIGINIIFPALVTNRGIVKKSLKDNPSKFADVTGSTINDDSYYIINFKLDIEKNQTHVDIVKRWHAFFMRCVEILYDSNMLPDTKRMFTKDEFMKKHGVVFKDPTYVSTYIDPNVVNTDTYKQYGSGMYLKLIHGDKFSTNFYGLNGSEIEWKFLTNATFVAVPIVNVRGISIINNIPHLVVRLRNATLIEPPKPQKFNRFRPELVQEYMSKENIEKFQTEMEKLKISDDTNSNKEGQHGEKPYIDDMLEEDNNDNVGIRSLLSPPPQPIPLSQMGYTKK
jgi:hypothetical protein